MSSAIDQYIEVVKEKNIAAFVHYTNLNYSTQHLLDTALTTWGGIVKNMKAAPSYQKTSQLHGLIQKQPFTFNLIIDETNSGVAQMIAPADFSVFSQQLLETLQGAARNAQVPEDTISQATSALTQYLDKFKGWEQEFSGQGAAHIQQTLLNTFSQLSLEIEHKNLGLLDEKATNSLFSERPKTEEELKQLQAQPLTGVAKYKSYHAMIQAKDAAALEEGIASAQKMGYWDESKEQMAQLLVFSAIEHGSLECLQVLEKLCDVDLSFSAENGFKPIHFAAQFNRTDVIEYLVTQHNLSPESASYDGHTPLMIAATSESLDAMEKLLDMGANIDTQALDGKTALHFAAMGSEDEEKTFQKSIDKLLSLGANPSIKEYIDDALPEEYVDENSDLQYAALVEARKRFESGQSSPRPPSVLAKVRSTLGI